MPDEKSAKKNKATGGYQPFQEGYQPTQSKLDSNDPPKGGSGVKSNSSQETNDSNSKNE